MARHYTEEPKFVKEQIEELEEYLSSMEKKYNLSTNRGSKTDDRLAAIQAIGGDSNE